MQRFQAAFADSDARTMLSCGHPQVHCSDPTFPDLNASEARGMRRMPTDLAIPGPSKLPPAQVPQPSLRARRQAAQSPDQHAGHLNG